MPAETDRWGVWCWAINGPFTSQGRWMMWGNPPRSDWTGTREAAEAEVKRFSIDDWKAEARPYVPTPPQQVVVFHGAPSNRTLTKTTVINGRYAPGEFPIELLPDGVDKRMGRYTVTVTFEPVEWLRPAPDGLGRVDCTVCGGRFTLSHRDPMCPHRLLP